MRTVIAKRLSRRGEGLGNEIIPWAKSFIASRVLDAHLSGTAWGLNGRKYWRNFETGRLDWVRQEVLLKSLPHYPFTQDDYRAAGRRDFAEAFKVWAEAKGLLRKQNYVVTVDGMYGGYYAIETAREFLWSKLLNSRRALQNIFDARSRIDPGKLLIAVHVRAGSDFLAETESMRSRFNVKLPFEWYAAAARSLKAEFGTKAQFLLLCDRPSDQFRSLAAELDAVTTLHHTLSECSDLCLLALADLRICSVSSYSLAACFLSRGPYIWCEEQLGIRNGLYSIWGHEQQEQQEGSFFSETEALLREAGEESRDLLDARNGFAVRMDGALPQALVERLYLRLEERDRRFDLVRYGAFPTGGGSQLA